MKAKLDIGGLVYTTDLDQGTPIGMSLDPFKRGPRCFYAEDAHSAPVQTENFIGSVLEGAPVNFYSLRLIPHGNGTHTESVGHISTHLEPVNSLIKNPFFIAELVTIHPEVEGEDLVISEQGLISALQYNTEVLIIRTLPNSDEKLSRDYSGTNPPYLSLAAMQLIVNRGYQHLLLDLPSVDREMDEGKLNAHHLFWNYPAVRESTKTITELIYAHNDLLDGQYILNLQICNIALDAVPSNPILYPILSIDENNVN